MPYSCLAIPISYEGDEISRLSRLVFEIWRGTDRQTDDRRGDRNRRLLHCTAGDTQSRILYKKRSLQIIKSNDKQRKQQNNKSSKSTNKPTN